MPYPPPVPPGNRTDATPQFLNHPKDHNLIANALMEILNHQAAVEAAEAERNRLVGVGVVTGSQLYNDFQVNDITWPSEAYDTDGFHVANSTDIVVPQTAGIAGAGFSCTLTVVANAAVTRDSLVRIVFVSAGGTGLAVKQNIITAGQVSATVSYTGPIAGGSILRGSFWNGGTANFIAASFEMLRVASP